jgi:hypothetical protein
MSPMRPLAVLLSTVLLVGTLQAGTIVRVTVHGEVEYNQVSAGLLGMVNTGDAASMSFLLDSDDFLDSAFFPTRGYVIDQDSFGIQFPTFAMPLKSPFPAGQTPYFVLRDNDPAVDGFLVSSDVNGPAGVSLQQEGGLSPNFINNFYVTYGGSDLSSLNLLDALGSYDFTGLTVFNWTIDDGPFNPVGLLFESMTIEIEAPWVDLGGGTVGVNGQPQLDTFGPLTAGSTTTIQITDAAPNAAMLAWLSFTSPAPFAALGGTVHSFPFNLPLLRMSDGAGSFSQSVPWPAGIPAGIDITLQFLVEDASSIHGITLSNAEVCTTP